jgi:hypothetical protein
MFPKDGILSVVILLCVAPAVGQQYYTPNTGGLACTGYPSCYSSSEIGPGIHYMHYTDIGTGCNGSPANDAGDQTVAEPIGTLTLRPNLQLLQANGQWIPQSITETGVTSIGGGQSTYTSTITAEGIVTTFEQGSDTSPIGGTAEPCGTESDTVISTETLDLNTGKYTWHRVVNDSVTGCSCAQSKVETQDRTVVSGILCKRRSS